MNTNNEYTNRQKNTYDMWASNWSFTDKDPVVGSFDAHNNWKDYDEFLFKDVGKALGELILLDFGCGPGRNIVKYNKMFSRLDGADISQNNINNAKLWIEYNQCKLGNLYCTNGVDLSEIPSNQYDVIMSTISLQHISVYDVRKSYFNEFYRVLKIGGTFTAQMGFGGASNVTTTNYFDSNYGNNVSGCDVTIRHTDELKNDLTGSGFSNFNYYMRPTGPGDCHVSWIFFNCKK